MYKIINGKVTRITPAVDTKVETQPEKVQENGMDPDILVTDFNKKIFLDSARSSHKSEERNNRNPQNKYKRKQWQSRVIDNPEKVIQKVKEAIPHSYNNNEKDQSNGYARRFTERGDYSYINSNADRIRQKLNIESRSDERLEVRSKPKFEYK